MKSNSIAKTILYSLIGLLLMGCNSKNEKVVESKTNISQNPIDEYNKLKQSVYSVEDVISHYQVKAYGVNCPGECGVRSLFTKRNEKVYTLNKEEFKRLIKILNNPNSYGAVTSACYHPSVGIITYNENETPLSYIGICLTCNNHESNIELNIGANEDNGYKYGYSPEGRKLLRTFLNEIEFDESGTISSFDYKEDRIKYLESKGMTEIEIKEEISNY